ncbi:ATP-binding protein [Nodosilinea sp. P-1105]|nr:ATP-binding protein [Nodosilinea sp. P-1105]
MASTPQSRPRQRKVVVLTQSGFQKLQAAQAQSDIWDNYMKTCTLEALSEQTGLSTHTLSKVHARRSGVDLRTLVRYFSAFGLPLEQGDYRSAEKVDTKDRPKPNTPLSEGPALPSPTFTPAVSWGTAPDVAKFYGRVDELATLQAWILEQRCRLIILSGMGGIGKTWLSAKLTEQLQSAFKFVLWRSLRPISKAHSPLPFDELLDDLLRNLDPQSGLSGAEDIRTKILWLIGCLQKTPCLIVLDNVESILKQASSGDSADGNISIGYQAGYEAYCELFRLIGQGRHQSCLMLTSRQVPQKLSPFSGENRQVRLFSVGGLRTPDIQRIFAAKGCFQGNADEWHHLVDYYGGNPFVLETAATTIQQFFGGSISEFLTYKSLLLDDIRELMDQQFGLLSESEKAVIGALAHQKMPCSLSTLRSHLSASITNTHMLGILKSLKARSLLAKAPTNPTMTSFPANYVRDYISQNFG